MKIDIYKGALFVSGMLVPMAGIALMEKLGHFSLDPKTFDAASGHVISVPVRGVGTVYLTLAEWDSVKPYLFALYASVGLLVLIVTCRLIYDGYRGFMQGWRS